MWGRLLSVNLLIGEIWNQLQISDENEAIFQLVLRAPPSTVILQGLVE